jgi:hypothetical protein
MKIKDKKVKNILCESTDILNKAKSNTYNAEYIARQQIDYVLGALNTLVTLIDFNEDE